MKQLERKVEVKTYITRVYCPICGKELDRKNNLYVLDVYPPKYTYSCSSIIHEYSIESDKSYPVMTYE